MRLALLVPLAGCQLVYPLESDVVPPAPIGTCSRPETLVDDFSSTTLAPLWSQSTSTAANEIALDGEAVDLRLFGSDSHLYLETVPYVDLRGAAITVDVSTNAGVGAGSDNFAELDVELPGFVWSATPSQVVGDALVLRRQGTRMEVARYAAGELLSLRNVEVETTPPVWRISHDGENVRWEVSQDGETFEELQRLPLAVGIVRTRLFGHQGFSGSFSARFDRLNGGEARGEICATSLLVDDFDAELDQLLWTEREASGCEIEVVDGALAVSPALVDPTSRCVIRTGLYFDLFRDGVTVELEQLLNPGHHARLRILSATATAELAVETLPGAARQLLARGSLVGTPHASPDYDPIAHRWLRVRAERDQMGLEQLLFETSADGLEFVEQGRSGDYAGLDRVRVEIGTAGPQTDPGFAKFFSVNVPPR
jgi:hypothetical protein